MRIALIHPKIVYRCEHDGIQEYVNLWYQNIFSRAFNINLLRLASLTPSDHEVILIDENYQDIPYEQAFDVIAVTAMTYQVERAYQIAAQFKENHPCHTILGGIHASVLPEEAGRFFDSVCVGEVENIWETFLTEAAAGKAHKFYRGEMAVLEMEPVPKYALVETWAEHIRERNFCFFPTMTTRGCPRGCDYCSATYLFEKRYRKKPIPQALAEIRSIKETARELKIQNYQVEFCDDNFIIDRKRSKELLTALIPEKISYTASLDIAAPDDPEIMELLGMSGCKVVSIGLESLEVNILEDLGQWKKSQRQKVEKNIQAFFDHGIIPAVNFMVGSDGTDGKVFRHIRQFLEEFPVIFNILFFTPFPGSPYLPSLQGQKRLSEDKTWTDYNLFNMVFEPQGMSKEALYDEFFSVRAEYNHYTQNLKCLKNLGSHKVVA